MITYKCDGECGDAIEEPNERGFTEKFHYCDDCVKKVDDFYTKRDLLHDKVVKTWTDGLKKLKSEFNGQLPD